jgi:hypothetical protein
MAAKLTILTHKIAIQLHLVAESRTICSSRSRRIVRKLLDMPLYVTILSVCVLPNNYKKSPNFIKINTDAMPYYNSRLFRSTGNTMALKILLLF